MTARVCSTHPERPATPIPPCSCGAPAAFVSFDAYAGRFGFAYSWCGRHVHDLRGDVGFILAPDLGSILPTVRR